MSFVTNKYYFNMSVESSLHLYTPFLLINVRVILPSIKCILPMGFTVFYIYAIKSLLHHGLQSNK